MDSGAAISLIRYSAYQTMDSSFKTPIQAIMTKLNTAHGLPMTALGMMAFKLRIADFKFTHNFIIYDRLPDMEILFGIDIQKKFSLSYAWDKEKNHCTQRMEDFSPTPETVNWSQLLGLSSQLSNTTQTQWHHSNQDQRSYNQRTYGILYQQSRFNKGERSQHKHYKWHTQH